MATAVITPKKLFGKVVVPPSKSELHRAIICAALTKNNSEIFPVTSSDDILATVNAVKALGAMVKSDSGKLIVNGSKMFAGTNEFIDCNESASTLRLLMPLATFSHREVIFKCRGNLINRPLWPYIQVFKNMGVHVAVEQEHGYVKIFGKLKPGKISLPGNVSSQFISGLLLALPLLSESSEIFLTTPLESAGYVDLTIDIMRKFSVIIDKTSGGFFVKGNQKYKQTTCEITGDWSAAAFWIVANAMGSNIEIAGIRQNAEQPDKEILSIINKIGVKTNFVNNSLTVLSSEPTATEIFSAQCPDLVPILSILAAKSVGLTKILGVNRLKFKETNRLDAIFNSLKVLGVEVRKNDDSLYINGPNKLKSAVLSGFKDHRIIMAMTIAATVAEGRIRINNVQYAQKSYPTFFDDFKMLGGLVNIIN